MVKVSEIWNPVENPLMTRWSKDVNPKSPLPEHPRPQMIREKWFNLNGLWNYAILPKNENLEKFNGKILVPFPIESALSGVKKKLKSSEKLYYMRKFATPDDWRGSKILLHFGAVDWEATVWVNKNKVGTHQGGYTPFSFEISSFVKIGKENELLVEVWDPTDKEGQERGKQSLNPKIIWYTAVSGIWQTVWLEPVPNCFIQSVNLQPDVDREAISISLNIKELSSEYKIQIEIFKEDIILIDLVIDKTDFTVNIPNPRLWSPSDPFLYDIKIKFKIDDLVVDEIRSYFGMRKISLGKVYDGIRTIALNNEQIFQYGTLDQGYWPDGLYTAPTDEALRYDVEITKKLGFNMIRKHVKIEPARWYYHCDKIGMLVWQDMPNGGFVSITEIPSNVSNYKEKRSESEKQNYFIALESMIKLLRNSPSVITWVPFNEGWGQFDTELVVNKIKSLDPTRLIDAASGWFDTGVGDICDQHNYPNPIMPQKEKINCRAAVIGEFGGLGLEVENHMWKFQNKFVYRNLPNQIKLLERYEKLLIKLKKLIEKGLSAAIYTQITDVEQEVNGLLTYDREIIKMDMNRLREVNLSLY